MSMTKSLCHFLRIIDTERANDTHLQMTFIITGISKCTRCIVHSAKLSVLFISELCDIIIYQESCDKVRT